MPFADMHTHTQHSDGMLEPQQLLQKAKEKGLEGLVITDHDNYDAYHAAREIAESLGILTTTGMEISTSYMGRDIHLLAYAFDANNPQLKDYTSRYREKRKNRAHQMIHKLRSKGFELSLDRLEELVGKGVHGRPHIAMMLQENGYVTSIKEAFDNFLTFGKKAFVPMSHIDIVEAIKMVKKARGVAIIAHPGKHTQPKVIHRLLHKGLDGLECIHPSHDDIIAARYKGLVDNYWMIGTGGSDYHGIKEREEDNFGKYHVSIETMKSVISKGIGK